MDCLSVICPPPFWSRFIGDYYINRYEQRLIAWLKQTLVSPRRLLQHIPSRFPAVEHTDRLNLKPVCPVLWIWPPEFSIGVPTEVSRNSSPLEWLSWTFGSGFLQFPTSVRPVNWQVFVQTFTAKIFCCTLFGPSRDWRVLDSHSSAHTSAWWTVSCISDTDMRQSIQIFPSFCGAGDWWYHTEADRY